MAYSPRIAYGLYEATEAQNDFGPQAGEKLIFADALAEESFAKAKLAYKRLRDVKADELATLALSHPLKGLGGGYSFTVPLLAGDHVTDDAGTGFVHTAPGHGREDFDAWMDAGRDLVARGIDTVVKTLGDLFVRAREHEGASFLEILQNCPVFNDGEWDGVTAREIASDNQLWVEHGKPMVFGKDKNKGLRLADGGQTVEVVTIGEGGYTLDDIAVHDERNRTLAFLLAQLAPPVFPMVFGVLYCDPGTSYDGAVARQTQSAVEQKGAGSIDALLRQGHTWTVE